MKSFKPSEIDTVIFDMDGTVLDTLEDLRNSLNEILRSYEYPERTVEEVRAFVGNGIRKLIERAVPEGISENKSEIDSMFHDFSVYYNKHCMDNTAPYKGIIPLMHELKRAGYKLAIVSNKPDDAVKELNRYFFSDDIKVAIGEKKGVRKKPAPDTVIEALRELGSEKENSVYIGDSDVDLKTAESSEMPCISVLWGFRNKDFLLKNGAEHFAEKAEDIKLILNIETK